MIDLTRGKEGSLRAESARVFVTESVVMKVKDKIADKTLGQKSYAKILAIINT